MLLFRSEELARRWCERHRREPGEILTPQQILDLSRLWYKDRLSVDYHGRTPLKAEEIFREAGLVSKFWQSGN